MPRARISASRGIEVAKPGYDVDTAALTNMMFSSQLVAMRLAETDVIAVAPHSDGGAFTAYYKATKYYSTPFPEAPIVLAAGINGDGTSDQSQLTIYGAGGGQSWYLPHYAIYTYPTRFDLYVLKSSNYYVGPTYWRYFVFQNTLQ